MLGETPASASAASPGAGWQRPGHLVPAVTPCGSIQERPRLRFRASSWPPSALLGSQLPPRLPRSPGAEQHCPGADHLGAASSPSQGVCLSPSICLPIPSNFSLTGWLPPGAGCRNWAIGFGMCHPPLMGLHGTGGTRGDVPAPRRAVLRPPGPPGMPCP